MATFGRAVVGPISDDERWLTNPLTYDPTRPIPFLDEQLGETPRDIHQDLATPAGEAEVLGRGVPAASDVDIGLMAELGEAITRGAELLQPGR